MLVSDYKKDVLAISEQSGLPTEISQGDGGKDVLDSIWAMAIFDFNKQNVSLLTMDYLAASTDILALCERYSDVAGLKGVWHIDTGFSYLCISELVIEDCSASITRMHALIDNPHQVNSMVLNFHAMGVFITVL